MDLSLETVEGQEDLELRRIVANEGAYLIWQATGNDGDRMVQEVDRSLIPSRWETPIGQQR